MKKKIIGFLACLMVVVFAGCEIDEDPGTLEGATTKASIVAGTWTLSKIYQNGTDITDYAIAATDGTTSTISGFSVTFQANGDTPTNYSITAGTLPTPAIASGSWTFDDVDFPEAIQFNAGGADESTATLINAPVVNAALVFEFGAGCSADGVTYRYELVKQ